MNTKFTNLPMLLILTIVVQGCCVTKQTTCPDSRPVTYQKNIKCANKAYNDAVKDFEFNVKATIDAIESVNVDIANLDVVYKSQLLKDKLNNESIRHQDALKASYLALSTDPCNNSKRHYKLVESITQKNYQLQELRESIKNGTNTNQVNNTLNNYLVERGKKEGKAMGSLTSTLDKYYKSNNKYPNELDELNIDDVISILSTSRIEYRKIDSNNYSLKFAGEDYALGTSDDKIYKGVNGKTVVNSLNINTTSSSNQSSTSSTINERIKRNRLVNELKEKNIWNTRAEVIGQFEHRLENWGGKFDDKIINKRIDNYLGFEPVNRRQVDTPKEYFTFNGASLKFKDIDGIEYGPVLGYHCSNDILKVILFTEDSTEIIYTSNVNQIDYNKIKLFLIDNYNKGLKKAFEEK